MMTEEEENAMLTELVNTPITDPRYFELGRKYPVPPEVALVAKEVYGVEFIQNCGFNFEKVEAKYGKDWITQ